MTKQQVMNLIIQMKNQNNREYAEFVYYRENALHPEWELKVAFEAMKGDKQ